MTDNQTQVLKRLKKTSFCADKKYSMSGTKPLIFVHPLSDSLKKLKEVIAETADEDGVEIYEVDDIMEVSQLLPSIGQSLTIFANPKKCAAVLQPNRRVIHKLNSKVILLSPKAIPRKTLDKFSKIGLTECVVEPVPPKTLLYKVKLLLRSIIVSGEEDEEQNEEVKFSHDDDENTDTRQKQRLEKGIISDNDNVIDYNLRGKLGTEIEIDAEDDEQEHGYKEGSIATDWEGKVSNDHLALETEDKEDKERPDGSYLDSYLRSKKKDHSDVNIDFDEPSKEQGSSDYNYEELENRKKSSTDSLEIGQEKRSTASDNQEETDPDDKYYKGKVNNSMFEMNFEDEKNNSNEVEEELDERKDRKATSEIGLDLSPERESKTNDEESEIEEDLYGKRSNNIETSLDLSEDDDDDNVSVTELDLERERKKEEEAPSEEQKKARSKQELHEDVNLGIEEEEEDQKKKDNEIDGYIRGSLAKTVTVIEEEEIDARNGSYIDAEEDNDSDNTHLNLDKGLDLDSDTDEDEDSHSSKLKLEREKEKQDEIDIEENEEDYDKTKSSSEINLSLDDTENDQNENDSFDEEDDFSRARKEKDLDLAFDQDETSRDQLNKEDRDKEFGRRKSGVDLDLEVENELKKHSAHTDRIETNLDSRKGIKHQEYDWDINKNKDNTENYGQEKKAKSQLDISFKGKVDLGEQTIDYRKLHSEFEAITINRSSSGKKSEGPKYYSENADKEFLKGIYDDDYLETLSDAEIIALKNKVDKHEETIYSPNANGIEVAIRVLNLYGNKKLNKDDLFSFICDSITTKFQGYTTFYNFNKNNKIFEKIYQSKENILDRYTDKETNNKDEWDQMNLPKWENEKFNSEDNLFFFPLYEGANKLGYITCYFENSPKEEIAKSIEVILETTRGIFLDESHKAGITADYNKPKEIVSKQPESNGDSGIIKSIFGKFFKKAS